MADLESPCRGLCRLRPDGVCDGCGRTLGEIERWATLPSAVRRAVLARV